MIRILVHSHFRAAKGTIQENVFIGERDSRAEVEDGAVAYLVNQFSLTNLHQEATLVPVVETGEHLEAAPCETKGRKHPRR